jgi:hypothetical protein
MSEVIVQPADYKYYKNDANFNPAKNKAIIAETIKETEKFFKEEEQMRDKKLENRIDLVSSYGVYRFNKGQKQFKDYVGRETYKAVIGEKLLSKIRVMDSVNKINGNDKFKKSILL